MRNPDVSADAVKDARAELSKKLYGRLDQARAELDRRSDILQSSQAGTAAAAQRHRAAHETEIGVRFAGRDKLVYLVGLGEVVVRLG